MTGPGEEESTVFCVSSRFSNFIVETRYGRYCLFLDFLSSEAFSFPRSTSDRKEWMEAISAAQTEYKKKMKSLRSNLTLSIDHSQEFWGAGHNDLAPSKK